MKNKSLVKISQILLIAIGAGLILTACSQPFPYIPITALRQINPAAPFSRVVMGLVGLVFLVAGFSLVKFLIQFIGLVGGGMVGLYLAEMAFPTAGYASIIGFVIGGIVGISIAIFAADVGIFITGILVGISLAQQAWPYLEGVEAPWYGLIIIGILGGVLTLFLFKYWVAALTSLIGAPLLGMALNLQPGYWAVLFIAGVLIQTLFSRQRAGAGV